MASKAIGIDLGTTYSCVAVWRNNQVEVIVNDQGNRTTPSCVAFTDTQRFIGDAAFNQAASNPTNTIFDAKRLIGRRFSDPIVQSDTKMWPFKVIGGAADKPMIVVNRNDEEKHFDAKEISSMVLGKMRDIAEVYLGSTVNDVVITVPAYFNDSQRQATRDAGYIIGLNVMQILNEPTAAAIAYGYEAETCSHRKKNIFIFDLGGGTLDVSILTFDKSNGTQVKAIAGDTHLGGQDFDNEMVNHFMKEFKRKHKKDISGDPRALRRLKSACERAKRVLSFNTNTTIELQCLYQDIDFNSRISREKFEELNKDHIVKCMNLVEKCLNDAKMDKSSIDEVVLVGGSSRIPKLQNQLREFFDQKELCTRIHADEAVACGAAIQAFMLSGEPSDKFKDLLVRDVTPLSLGLDKKYKGRISKEEVERMVKEAEKYKDEDKKFKENIEKRDELEKLVYDVQSFINDKEVCLKLSENDKKNINEKIQLALEWLEANVNVEQEDYEHYEIILASVFVPAISNMPEAMNIPAASEKKYSWLKGLAKYGLKFVIDGASIAIFGIPIKQNITITNDKRRMSKKEVERMVKEAEKYKDEDKKFKENIEKRNELEKYVYDVQSFINNEEIVR